MRSVLWPNRRIKPPYGAVEIDRAHPLAQGLWACYLLNEGAGTAPILDLCRRVNFVAGAGCTASPYGRSCAAATGGIGSVASKLGSPSEYSVVLQVTFNSVSEKQDIFTLSVDHIVRIETEGRWRAYYYDTDYRLLQGESITVATPYQLALTGRAGSQAIYTNGALTATAANAGAPGYVGASSYFGRHDSSGVNLLNGEIRYVYFYHRILSASEIAGIYADPYCFLRPVVRRSYGWKAAVASGFVPYPSSSRGARGGLISASGGLA